MHSHNNIPVLVKRLDHFEGLELPDYATDGAAGMDVLAAEDVTLAPGARHAVATGFAVAIPPGYEIQVRPRSGLALKHGIALVNSPGLIDPGYRGEVRVLLLNTDANAEFKVAAGDRIAQLLLVPIATASPVSYTHLTLPTNREV